MERAFILSYYSFVIINHARFIFFHYFCHHFLLFAVQFLDFDGGENPPGLCEFLRIFRLNVIGYSVITAKKNTSRPDFSFFTNSVIFRKKPFFFFNIYLFLALKNHGVMKPG